MTKNLGEGAKAFVRHNSYVTIRTSQFVRHNFGQKFKVTHFRHNLSIFSLYDIQVFFRIFLDICITFFIIFLYFIFILNLVLRKMGKNLYEVEIYYFYNIYTPKGTVSTTKHFLSFKCHPNITNHTLSRQGKF